MKFIKNPTVIIIILGLIVGSSLYFYNSYQAKKKAAEEAKKLTTQTTTTAIADLTNADPNDYTSEIKKELDLANSKAVAYNPAETLSAIEITIPGKLTPRSGNATYIFDSTTDPKLHYTITISQATQTYIRASVPKEDYYGNLTTINQKSWKISYIDALKAAEKNGGQDWRSKNTLNEVQLVLKNSEPKGWLYWAVTYKGENSPLTLQFDAFSGRYVPQEEIEKAKSSATVDNSNQTSP